MENSKKVFVGLSGGVDSSVSAALLKHQGFDVTGVYIKGWYPDWKKCSWKEDRRDAMRVCAVLDIPFETLDLSKEYKEEVIDYFLSEYKIGRTPNPDVMCNKYIKFGGFYNWTKESGVKFIATGHYAQIKNYKLYRGLDQNKDQSYFLWALRKEQLDNILFPIGNLRKEKVRKLAKKFKLSTHTKKDSQGICFLEDISMEDFLKHYFPAEEGNVLGQEGSIIGKHEGAVLYTIGQRHGFRTDKKTTVDQAYFVISKDLDKNTITVSHDKMLARKEDVFNLEKVNWMIRPKSNTTYLAQMRYRQTPVPCVLSEKDGIWQVSFVYEEDCPVPGQSLVVYDKEICMGGGIIS